MCEYAVLDLEHAEDEALVVAVLRHLQKFMCACAYLFACVCSCTPEPVEREEGVCVRHVYLPAVASGTSSGRG